MVILSKSFSFGSMVGMPPTCSSMTMPSSAFFFAAAATFCTVVSSFFRPAWCSLPSRRCTVGGSELKGAASRPSGREPAWTLLVRPTAGRLLTPSTRFFCAACASSFFLRLRSRSSSTSFWSAGTSTPNTSSSRCGGRSKPRPRDFWRRPAMRVESRSCSRTLWSHCTRAPTTALPIRSAFTALTFLMSIGSLLALAFSVARGGEGDLFEASSSSSSPSGSPSAIGSTIRRGAPRAEPALRAERAEPTDRAEPTLPALPRLPDGGCGRPAGGFGTATAAIWRPLLSHTAS